MQYQHKAIYRPFMSCEELETEFNQLGVDGWHLVGVDGKGDRFYFVREL